MNAAGPYAEALLREARAPAGAGKVPRGTEDAAGENESCGDEIRVRLAWSPEGKLAEMVHETHGCALCRASAGMAARLLAGKDRGEALAVADDVLERMGKTGFAADSPLSAFNGVEAFPSRVACAKLAWETVRKAIRGKDKENGQST
jgi:nitrogen fixation NifU-like protein